MTPRQTELTYKLNQAIRKVIYEKYFDANIKTTTLPNGVTKIKAIIPGNEPILINFKL